MRSIRILAIGLFGLTLAASGSFAQETTTTTTQQTSDPQTKTVTVTGSVVKYTPGHLIVVRGPDRREVTYTLTSGADVPTDVAIGKSVTLYTEPASAGVTRVTRVTTVNADGTTTSTTTKTAPSAAGAQPGDSSELTITGTVQSYETGRTITITKDDGSQVTYTLTAQSAVPQGLSTGKTVTLRTRTVSGSPVVQRVTYTTKSTTVTK